MARTRTTKKLAQRIDLNYFKRPTPFKRAKLWLSILLPLLALAWIIFFFAKQDQRLYSSGHLSEPHAVFEKECSTCHVQTASSISASVPDSACLACHDGPPHHVDLAKAPGCAECHSEHRGRVNLSAASNAACAQCHANPQLLGPAAKFSQIKSLENGHPEISVLRPIGKTLPADPGTIKLNHALHMKPIRRGPGGPNVQLACGDCHRSAGSIDQDWKYGDAQYNKQSREAATKFLPLAIPDFKGIPGLSWVNTKGLDARSPESKRERMAPPAFANACAGCHLLTFDKRFEEGVPHDKPEVIHVFLIRKFSEYIAAHPAELREVIDPSRTLTGKPLPPATQFLTPVQWVQQKTAVAEELLWKKTCAQCHSITGANFQDTSIARWKAHDTSENASRTAGGNSTQPTVASQPLPAIAESNLTLRWLPHAKFSHDAHTGFTCEGCHTKAPNSVESSDILIPGIATCQTCHAPGPEHTESRCFECHTYHDWSKRKEVRPTFTLPALRSTGN